MVEVKEIHGTEDFDNAKSTARVVLFDFSAVWCGPCQSLGPILDTIAEDYPEDDVKIYRIDVDENEDLTRKFRISSVPVVAFYKDGEMHGQLLVGLREKKVYVKIIDDLLA